MIFSSSTTRKVKKKIKFSSISLSHLCHEIKTVEELNLSPFDD